MHEMSIAMNIFDIVCEKAGKENASRIVEIELDIGTQAGIEFQALEFALGTINKNDLLKKTLFKINKIMAKAECNDCHNEFEMINLYSPCPYCSSYNNKLITGKELRIKSILIE